MTDHPPPRQHVRQLIDGSGREARARPECARKKRRRQKRRVGVDDRIAEVDAYGAPAVLALHGSETLAGLFQRSLPGNGLPAAAFSPLRLEDAVGIALDVRDGSGLRTDVPMAEGIVRVAPDAANRRSLQLDGKAPHCL